MKETRTVDARACPTTPRFEAKREAILDIAAQVFNAKGIRGGTLSEIARGVGLSTNSVTYYYRRHEDLVAACLLRTIDMFNQTLDHACTHETVALRVEALWKEFLRVLAAIKRREHPELITFADARTLQAPHSEPVFAAYNAVSKRVRDLLKAPQTAHLSKDELSARSYLLVSAVSWTRLWTPACDVDEFDLIARRSSDLMLNGLGTALSTWNHSACEASFWERFDATPGLTDPFLCAAAHLVNRHGYHGASIERISAHLNRTKGAFYGRRGSKDELIVACFEKKSFVMQLAWEGLEFGSASGWERLCTVLRRLMWFQLSERGPLVRTTAILAVPGDEFQQTVRHTIARSDRMLANAIIDGMEDGSIRPCDPAVAAHILSCAIDHAAGVSGWVRSVDGLNVAEMFLRPLLFGLLDRQPRSGI